MSKKAAAKKGGAPADDIDFNEILRGNYKKACATLGISQNPVLLKMLNNEEDPAAPILEMCIDVDLGSAGLRALAAALLAKGSAMKTPAYKHLRALKLWRACVGDPGAAAVAELLRNGKDDIALTTVQFLDCGLAAAGCAALGEALMLGANTSLTTLLLDLNSGVGDAGMRELCKGLRTNRHVTKLSLTYCSIGVVGAEALAEVLLSPLSKLESIDLTGNALGADGCAVLSLAARRNTSLKELILVDNGIGGGNLISTIAARHAGGVGMDSGGAAWGASTASLTLPPTGTAAAAAPDAHASMALSTRSALQALGEALADTACSLDRVNLEMNSFRGEEVEVLLPYVIGNSKLQMLRLDPTLPPALFVQLCKSGVASKGKKKKAGGAGKKKKK